jgi:hypothetical protein
LEPISILPVVLNKGQVIQSLELKLIPLFAMDLETTYKETMFVIFRRARKGSALAC